MAFNGEEGKMIDPAVAQKWIDNYKRDAGKGAIYSQVFGFRRLNELMSQDKSIGIRICYAKDDEGVQHLVLFAVTQEEQNIAKVDGGSMQGFVLDDGPPCPPYCPKE